MLKAPASLAAPDPAPGGCGRDDLADRLVDLAIARTALGGETGALRSD